MREIPDPGVATDDGTADPALMATLTAYGAGTGACTEVLAALTRTRVLVPVVTVLGEAEVDAAGRTHDKSSDMAAVLMTGADGRLALLAFTSTTAMTAWDAQARPVPVQGRIAAQAALQQSAAAVVLDVAGPTTFAVEGDDLTALASG